MTVANLPVLSAESGLSRYLREIRKFPILDQQEEYMLAKAFADHGDVAAAHKLVTSHLRLVVKMAMGFKGYGLPLVELISEGNIGLMQAVKKFNPEAGFRLSTYAMWWIKAAIQEYVLRSWSLVKMGTTAVQKKLFFNLRKLKHRLDAYHEGDLRPDEIKSIATELDVPEHDVVDMDRRMKGGDYSLNKVVSAESEDEWGDFLADSAESHEITIAENQDMAQKKLLLTKAMENLTARERDIFRERRLSEEPATLDDLSKIYNISKERVRQIENRAMEKIQQLLLENKAGEAA